MLSDQETLCSSKIKSELGAYQKYYENIYHCIVNQTQNPVTPNAALDVIKLIELAQSSSQEKKWVKI